MIYALLATAAMINNTLLAFKAYMFSAALVNCSMLALAD